MTPRKTHCKRGHPRTPDNISGRGQCNTCRNEARRANRVPVPRKPPTPKKRCVNGHERTPDNIGTHGHCLTCKRQRDQARTILRKLERREAQVKAGTHCTKGHRRTPGNTTANGRCKVCISTSLRLTHCKRGHERTPENVNQWGDCRLCARERDRKYEGTRRGTSEPAAAHEYNVRGIQSYIARRRARGVPVEGRRVA